MRQNIMNTGIYTWYIYKTTKVYKNLHLLFYFSVFITYVNKEIQASGIHVVLIREYTESDSKQI